MPLNDEYWQTTEGMQKLDAEGLLNWQDSVGFNMSNLSLEREALLNEQLKADMANKAAMAGMASQYLGSWNEQLAASNNMLNSAAQSIQQLLAEEAQQLNAALPALSYISTATSSDGTTKVTSSENQVSQETKDLIAYQKGQASANQAKIAQIEMKMDAAIADLNKNIGTFQKTYGGLENTAIDTAIAQLGATKSLSLQLKDAASMDVEGAATRAKADMSSEATAAREKMADHLVSLGIDPTSGTGMAVMREMMGEEALGKVMAANTARIDEKNRAVAAGTAALNAIRPAESAGIALGIQGQRRDLMSDRNNMITEGAKIGLEGTRIGQMDTQLMQGALQLAQGDRKLYQSDQQLAQADRQLTQEDIRMAQQYALQNAQLANDRLKTKATMAGTLADIAATSANSAGQVGEFGAALLGASY